MSFQNLQTNEIHNLTCTEPVILGRGKYGLDDPYASRQHVKITLLYNGKCFMEKLSNNMAKLNNAHLPENKEIEAYDQDILEIPVNNLFRLNLPKSSKGVYRPTTIVANESDDDTDDEFEPLSLVEQTGSQLVSAATLEPSMEMDEQEEEKKERRDNELHHSSSSSDDEENAEADNSHLLLSDGSISSESDLLGDY